MAPATATFEEIDQDHRRERAEDRERLRTGQITPEALQGENSFIPKTVKVRFVDFAASLEKAYAARA